MYMYMFSTQHHLKMPTGLGQFGHLAEAYMLERNFINKLYWDIKKTIWIPIRNNSGTTKHFNIYKTIRRSYKNDKPLRPDMNASAPHTNKYAPFHDLVDPRDLEWCVISSNVGANYLNRMSITCTCCACACPRARC